MYNYSSMINLNSTSNHNLKNYEIFIKNSISRKKKKNNDNDNNKIKNTNYLLTDRETYIFP